MSNRSFTFAISCIRQEISREALAGSLSLKDFAWLERNLNE